MPYYKWRFRALRDLSWPKNFIIKSKLNGIEGIEDESYYKIPFEKKLEDVISIPDEKLFNNSINRDISLICEIFVERLKIDKLTDRSESYLEPHAYEVNNKIKDNELRNMHILVGV